MKKIINNILSNLRKYRALGENLRNKNNIYYSTMTNEEKIILAIKNMNKKHSRYERKIINSFVISKEKRFEIFGRIYNEAIKNKKELA